MAAGAMLKPACYSCERHTHECGVLHCQYCPRIHTVQCTAGWPHTAAEAQVPLHTALRSAACSAAAATAAASLLELRQLLAQLLCQLRVFDRLPRARQAQPLQLAYLLF